MNSKTRMAKAMQLQQPDRVPVMCQLALGHYFLHSGQSPIEVWHSTEAFGEALIELQRRYGFDGILVNLPGRDPGWRSHVKRIEESEGETVIRWENGWFTVCPADDNPHVYRADGTVFAAEFTDIEPENLFYVEPHDLAGPTYPTTCGFSGEGASISYSFPSCQFDTIDYVVTRVGDEVSIHGEIFSPFTQFLELLGYTAGLLALIDDPEKCKACLDALCQGAILLGQGQAEHNVDAIVISSAFAGRGFISPHHYRQFVLPFEQKVIDGIRAETDIPIYTHTCGPIGDRLELLEMTGTNGIDTLDPPPLGNVDLADAKRWIGDRLFIKGNLDPVRVILQGTEASVLAEAKRCLDIGAPGGGYILSSACSIPPHSPPANILKLHEAVESFGMYDDPRRGSV